MRDRTREREHGTGGEVEGASAIAVPQEQDRRTFLKSAAVTAALLTPGVALAQPSGERSLMPAMSGRAAGRGRPARVSDGAVEGFRRMRATLTRHVERGTIPGAVGLVARGDAVHVEVVGTHAFGDPTPMRRDTIFRIASVTKPITAVAAMMLVEECRIRLDDPSDEWLPELADRPVLRSLERPLYDTVPAARPITLRDLLTFRLGLGAVMTFPERYPIQAAMREAGIAPSAELPAHPPDEMMKRYGSVPLLHQPGSQWLYNTGSDILGVLISRVSGRSLGDFLRERIFDPLGMRDTGFSVPPSQIHRLPGAYQTDFSSGRLVPFDLARGGRFARPPAFESGAGGLVSTADDLLAFARMMLAHGSHGKQRLLSRASVELMTTDQITPEQKGRSPFFPDFWDRHGWGFGVGIATRRDDLSTVPGRYGWDGGYGTSWHVDPAKELIGVFLSQRVWDSFIPPAAQRDFWTCAYQTME